MIENGSWKPKSGASVKRFLDEEMKQMSVLNSKVAKVNNKSEMDTFVDSILDSMDM